MIDQEYARCGELTDFHLQQHCAEQGMNREWQQYYDRAAKSFDADMVRSAAIAQTRISGMPEMHSIDIPSRNTPVMVNGKLMPMWKSAQMQGMGRGHGGHGGGGRWGGGGWGGWGGWGPPGWAYDPWGPDIVIQADLPAPCQAGQMAVYNPQIGQTQCVDIPSVDSNIAEGLSGLGQMQKSSKIVLYGAIGAALGFAAFGGLSKKASVHSKGHGMLIGTGFGILAAMFE